MTSTRRAAKAAPRAKTALRLPTLKTFLTRPIERRAALFGRWLEAQPRKAKADYWDTDDCPLARFGRAIVRGPINSAGGWDFALIGGERIDVFADSFGPWLGHHTLLIDALKLATFGSISDAYNAALSS